MILVTGATGLIGSHLIYNLLKTNDKIIAVKRKNSNLENTKKVFSYYSVDYENLFSRIIWREAEILNIEELNDAFEGVTHVYHCAAIVSFNSKTKKNIIKHNVEYTANVVNVSLKNKIKKLCHVSSIASLGGELNKVTTETSHYEQVNTKSKYSESKYQSELEVWRGAEEGLDVVIVNPSVVIGPGNWKNGSTSIIYNIWKGLKFYTQGITGYVDVNDVANIMIMLMNSEIKSERFIITSENISFKDLFSTISENLKVKPPKYEANKFMLNLAWRFDKIKSLIPGQQNVFTKELAKSALEKTEYSNEKIIKYLNYKFLPINKSIENTTKLFLNDFSKQQK